MNVTYTFRNIEASDGIRNLADEKIEHKLSPFFEEPTEIHVILEVEGVTQRVELTLTQKGLETAAHAETDDMYKSIDEAVRKMRRQLRKHKERRKEHHPH